MMVMVMVIFVIATSDDSNDMIMEILLMISAVYTYRSKPEVDVFEMSRNRNAVQVRRTPGDRANSQALEDFNALRYKGTYTTQEKSRIYQ
jgi:hypothetical protein